MKRKSIGLRHTALDGSTGRSKAARASHPYLAICVCNRGNQASLELGKAYKIIKPRSTDPAGRVRVIDEEGEDYLYLAEWFVPVEVNAEGKRRVMGVVA